MSDETDVAETEPPVNNEADQGADAQAAAEAAQRRTTAEAGAVRAAEDVRVTRATLQDENDRATRNTMRGIQDLEGMQFFALILVFFQMMTGQPIDEDMLASLSQNFGIDQEQLTGIVRDYQSGNISSFEAASQAYGAMDRTRANLPGATHAVSAITGIDIGERQRLVAETIPEVAAELGLSEDYMQGLWGYESTFGQNLMSPTGCEGDWQFSQGTWDNVMRDYGEQIAAHIEEDYPEKAAEIRANHDRAGSLNEYQYDPVVSTWASGYLNLENSRALGIDPSQESSFGMMYAAYNIGPGNAETLKAAAESGDQRAIGPRLGNVATWNPSFFTGGASGAEALERYSSVIHQREDDYERLFAQIQASEQPGYVTGAEYNVETRFNPSQFSIEAIRISQNDNAGGGYCAKGVANIINAMDIDGVTVTRGNARDWDTTLPQNGWVALEGFTPETAPPGAIIVYPPDANGRGQGGGAEYGHVEIAAVDASGNRTFVSDRARSNWGGTVADNGYTIYVNPNLHNIVDPTQPADDGTALAALEVETSAVPEENGSTPAADIEEVAAADAGTEAAAVADISASDTAPEATLAAVSAPADTAASPQDDPLAPTDATSAVSLSEQFGPADQPQGVDQVAASAAADPPAAAPAADATASEEVVLAASSPPPAQQRASAGMAV